MNDIFLHVKCLGSIAKQMSSFSARFFFDLQKILILDENLGEILLEILPRFSASFLLPRF